MFRSDGCGRCAMLLPLRSTYNHRRPNPTTLAELAAALRRSGGVDHLAQIQAHLTTTGLIHDPRFASKLISSLASLNTPTSISAARSVALRTHGLDAYTRNVVIRGFLDVKEPRDAILLYAHTRKSCLEVDSYTLLYVIKSCELIGAVPLGEQFHAHVRKLGFTSEVVVGTAILGMYGSFDEIEEMRRVFDEMPHRDVVAWNSAISTCSRRNRWLEALQLTREMVLGGLKINGMTAVSALSACSSLRISREGSSVHGYLIRNEVDLDVFVYNALLHMHCKCGSSSRARRIFCMMPHHNAISWTTMVSGYASNSCLNEALSMLSRLETSELKLDEVSLLCLISTCSESQSSRLVQRTLPVLEKSCPGRRKTVAIANALVSMHARCGDIARACEVFNEMDERTVVSWTSMIHGLAIHGYGEAALVKFFHMQAQGIDPDEVVFLSVLFACSHSGLIEEGKRCFDLMTNHYGMIPSLDHYGCMVDLLCRGGLIDEGFDFVMGMPVEPDMILWHAFLGACLNHGHHKLASMIRNRIRESGPRSSEDYVILSNSCAMADGWDIVKEVRDEMNAVGVTKNDLGYSFIENEH